MHIDPLTEDDTVAIDRQEEDIRAERWTKFVELTKRFLSIRLPSDVTHTIAWAMQPDYHVGGGYFPDSCVAFAETEGWAGVLAATARAMREYDHAS